MKINRHSIIKKIVAFMLVVAMVPTLVPNVSYAKVGDDDGNGAKAQATETVDNSKAEAEETQAPEKEEPAAEEQQPVQQESEPAEVKEETSAPAQTQQPAQDTSDDVNKTSQEEADEETEEEEEDKYPACAFSQSAGGMAVKISAPEGALPEGTKVTVTGVSTERAKKIAQRAVGDDGKIRDARGVDITFHDKNGKKIEPKKAVQVTLSGAGVRGDDPAIYH